MAPVSKVTAIGVRARAGQKVHRHLVHAIGQLTASALEVSHVEGQDLNHHSEHIDCLERDEKEEPGVVASANAAIQPRAVMVISFHALIAYVAVVASRQLDDMAVEANLMDCETIEELGLRSACISSNEARTQVPCHPSCGHEK